MGLTNPVVIYRAANNIEANLIKIKLAEAGIDSYVMEDDAMIMAQGINPAVLRPEVYVEESQTAAATALIQEYERDAQENDGGEPE